MPVYNAGAFLQQAIDSILKQTFREYEFLVMDDGSTDGSQDRVCRHPDVRVRFVQNEKNLGVAQTLNRGLDLAHGAYIARMDADDISLPDRLMRQVEFMERNPGIGIAGGWAKLLGENERAVDRRAVGTERVRSHLFFENPMIHPTVMMRKSILDDRRLRYDPAFSRSEDYDLWCRAAWMMQIDNIPEVLLRFRVHPQRITSTSRDDMETQSRRLQRSLLRRLGIEPNEMELEFHRRVGHGMRLNSREEAIQAERWLLSLADANLRAGVVEHSAFLDTLRRVWFRTCANSGPLGWWLFRYYCGSRLVDWRRQPTEERVQFLLSLVYHSLRHSSRK